LSQCHHPLIGDNHSSRGLDCRVAASGLATHPAIDLTGGGVADVVPGGSSEFLEPDSIRSCGDGLCAYRVGRPGRGHLDWHDAFDVILEQHFVDRPSAGSSLDQCHGASVRTHRTVRKHHLDDLGTSRKRPRAGGQPSRLRHITPAARPVAEPVASAPAADSPRGVLRPRGQGVTIPGRVADRKATRWHHA
jgi:hypothetical protein